MRTMFSLAVASLLLCPASHAAQLSLAVGAERIAVSAPDGYHAVRITLSAPDGSIIERRFEAKQGSTLDLGLRSLLDGSYQYRLDFEANSRMQDGRRVADAYWPQVTGSFGVAQGALARDEPESGAQAKDQVIPDDLIVQGSLCVGFDCVNNESFGFDTIRLKENSTRIAFDDTSVGAFPANDWQILANDSASGGVSRLSIEDITGARTPFTVIAGAATHSLFVDSTGRVGLRTNTPVLDLHVNTSNTPALRMEQNNSGGFTAQTWDLAGNEANFFIRDVTSGSRLPFRIRPGAPTSSIDILADGSVSFGDGNASARVDITANAPLASPIAALRITNDNGSVPDLVEDRFVVDSSGNVTARGTIAQLSSRSAKEACDAGRGVGPGGRGVYLDFRDSIKRLGRDAIADRYGNLFDMYQRITGEDPYAVPMRIYPAPHYTMGGLWVDYNLMSTIPGLHVLGEANFSDHGANRLGASALMQGLADGYFVLPYTIGHWFATAGLEPVSVDQAEFKRTEAEVSERLGRLLKADGKRSPDSFHKELGKLMWDNAGMARNAAGLKANLARIPELRERFWKDVRVPGDGEDFNVSLEKAARVADFLEFAEVFCLDALERAESCGGHFREESQTADGEAQRDDANYCHASVWEWTGEPGKPRLHKEPLSFENVKLATRSYK